MKTARFPSNTFFLHYQHTHISHNFEGFVTEFSRSINITGDDNTGGDDRNMNISGSDGGDDMSNIIDDINGDDGNTVIGDGNNSDDSSTDISGCNNICEEHPPKSKVY